MYSQRCKMLAHWWPTLSVTYSVLLALPTCPPLPLITHKSRYTLVRRADTTTTKLALLAEERSTLRIKESQMNSMRGIKGQTRNSSTWFVSFLTYMCHRRQCYSYLSGRRGISPRTPVPLGPAVYECANKKVGMPGTTPPYPQNADKC